MEEKGRSEPLFHVNLYHWGLLGLNSQLYSSMNLYYVYGIRGLKITNYDGHFQLHYQLFSHGLPFSFY